MVLQFYKVEELRIDSFIKRMEEIEVTGLDILTLAPYYGKSSRNTRSYISHNATIASFH